MKIKVIKAFNDKENGFITRPVNETFEATEARARELIDGGFVVAAETAQTAAQSNETGEAEQSAAAEKKPAKRRTKAAKKVADTQE